MHKRRALLVGLAITVMVAVVIGWMIRSEWLPPEPVYQGHALSYWLPRAIMENNNGEHHNHDHYREALAATRTQAIPFILARLRKNDSPLADKYRALWPRFPAALKRLLPAPKPPDYFAPDAAAGLMCLGPEAIPQIIDFMDDSDPAVREAAAQALCGFAGGALSIPDTAKIFGSAVKDADPAVRVFAAFALSRIGAAASNAVPALVLSLNAPQTNRVMDRTFFSKAAAACALAAIGRPAGAAIPALTASLSSVDHDTQCFFTNAINAIQSPPTASQRAAPLTGARAPVLPPTPSGQLQLWLKADAGVVTNAFGRVHEWRDQSSRQNNAVQPYAALEPLLVFPRELAGRPALRFDGVPVYAKGSYGGLRVTIGSYLKGAGQVNIPRAMTSFCVHRLNAPSGIEQTLWVVGEANPPNYGQTRGDMVTDGLMRFTTWAYDYDAPFAVPAGDYRIRADRLAENLRSVDMFDMTEDKTARFNLAINRPTPPPLPGYLVGGYDPDETFGRNWHGEIAEILIYKGALDDQDMQAITRYLREKYFPGSSP